MRRFWERLHGGDIQARLCDEHPISSQPLIDGITAESISASRPRTTTRARKCVAIAFASLVLGSTFGAGAIAAAGGNGESGAPADCVDGTGHVRLHYPNC